MGATLFGRRTAMGIALALLAPSCAVGTWTGDPEAPRVVVIGDSLTYYAERGVVGSEDTLLTDELVAGGAQAYVTGWTGLTVGAAYPDVWDHPSRQDIVPDVLVVALGTNDMHIYVGETEPRVAVADAQAMVHTWLSEVPAACVRLIGVAEAVTGWGLDVSGPAWNAMLAEEAALHGNAEYVPWEPDLAWIDGGANPHPNPDGRAAYRDLIASEALECVVP